MKKYQREEFTVRILLVKPRPGLDTILKLRPIMLMEPLELGYLAAAAGTGHDIKVLDLRLTDEPEKAICEALSGFVPDLIGFTAYTHESETVKNMASNFKKEFPEVKIVVGGHHATVLPEDFNVPQIDLIIRSEGSLPFREIVRRISAGEPCGGIPNVLLTGCKFDSESASVIPEYPELNKLPFPRRDLWDYRKYTCLWPCEEHPPLATIFPPTAIVRSSYGCRMNCSFCVIPKLSGRRHLTRDPEKLADELESLKADHVYFCDDETFTNPEYIQTVAEVIIRRKIKKRYFAWARSTTVNRHPELFKLWREIGLDAVFLGYESISNKILKDWTKGATLAEHEKAHKFLNDNHIAVTAGFMLLPQFTANEFDALANYMRNMPPAQFNITVCTPSPGSPDWERDREDFICDPYRFHDCMHPFTPTALPIKEFYSRYADLIMLAAEKNPLRKSTNKLSLLDIGKVAHATASYAEAVRNAWSNQE